MTFSPQKLADNIKRLRTAQGLTQVQLAKRAGISSASVSNIETARYTPVMYTVCALAEYFGVTLDELCYEVHDEQT